MPEACQEFERPFGDATERRLRYPRPRCQPAPIPEHPGLLRGQVAYAFRPGPEVILVQPWPGSALLRQR